MQFKVTSKYFLATLPLGIAMALGSCGGGDDDETTANPTTNLNPSSGSTTGTTPSQPVKYQLTRAESDYGGDGSVEAVYTYTADAAGNLTRWEFYGQQGELRHIGTFTYDANKRLVKEVWDSEGWKEGKQVPLDGVIDGIIEYGYDGHGNLTRVYRKDANYNQTYSYTNKYSANGQLIQEQSDYESDGVIDDVVNYTYDANGRLTQQQFDNDGDAIIDEVDSYSYDANGRLIKLEYTTKTDTTTTTYAYDANGRLSQQKLVYSDDNTSYTTGYSYSATGKLVKMEVNVSSGGNPATKTYTTYGYDANGNMVEQKRYGESEKLSYVARYGWQPGEGYIAFHLATDACLLVQRRDSPEEKLFDSAFGM